MTHIYTIDQPSRKSSFTLDNAITVNLLPGTQCLPPQYALDCRGTRVREDAVSWRRNEDGYRVLVSAAFADRDQHFDFFNLPKNYEIWLKEKRKHYGFSTAEERLAITAEFFTIDDTIFSPSLYMSTFRVKSFHCNKIGSRDGKSVYGVPTGIHEEISDLTGVPSPAEAVSKLLRAQNRIVAQAAAQHEAALVYHSNTGYTPMPTERPFTKANASLRRDEDALALRQLGKLLRDEPDLFSARKVGDFIKCMERAA